MKPERVEAARELLRKACQLQIQGELEAAAGLFRQSIALHPTAGAHALLGAAYHLLGRLDEAIAECRRAIELDASSGHPYNEIGACLMELGRHEEAIPWLEQATRAAGYDACHLAWHRLGLVYLELQLYALARDCFQHALDIEPDFEPAGESLDHVRRLIQ